MKKFIITEEILIPAIEAITLSSAPLVSKLNLIDLLRKLPEHSEKCDCESQSADPKKETK